MKIELSVHACGMDGVERSYDYTINLGDKTPMEQVEAHAKSMLRILDAQANESALDDDDDDGDSWRSPPDAPDQKKAP